MSVLVPIIDYIDGDSRRIYLKQGVLDIYPIEDLYHEYRDRRRLDTDGIRTYKPLLKAEGNVSKGGGKFTPRYIVLLTNDEGIQTKIIPFNEAGTINQLGDIITDYPDVDEELYDLTQLTVAKPIYIQPPGAEVLRLDSADIQYASYGGCVSVDINSTLSGTTYPAGNQGNPVNNFHDAVTIAHARGFIRIVIRTSMVVGGVEDIVGFTIEGISHTATMVTLETELLTHDTTFSNLNITNGFLDGGSNINLCKVGNVTYFNGHIHDSAIYGKILLDGNANASLINCKASGHGLPPEIDMGGAGNQLSMSNWTGKINITNLSDPTMKVGIGIDAGGVILDPSVTEGNFLVSGIGLLTDNSGVNANVNSDGLMNRELITKATWDRVHLDSVNGKVGTDFPLGTLNNPSSNLADAMIIAVANNIKILELDTSLVLTQSVAGFELNGKPGVVLDFNGQSVAGCIVTRCALTGVMADEAAFFDQCSIYNISNMAGSFMDCWFNLTAPITVSGVIPILMSGCASAIPGSNSPILDFVNGNIVFNMRAYSGGIKIINSTDPFNTCTFEFIAGKFNFPVSNTEGYFAVRGVVDTTNIEGTSDVNTDGVAGSTAGAIGGTWTEDEKVESLAWSRKASDNAEQANLKLS